MTPPLIPLFLVLLFAVCHAGSVGPAASSNGADPIIRLPTEIPDATPLTQSTPLQKIKPNPIKPTEVDLKLLALVDRQPVHLLNRFRFPLIRFTPRRCEHGFFRHVAEGAVGKVLESEKKFRRHHHHHHDHDDDDDHSDDDDDEHEEKREKKFRHRRHEHHHHHDHEHEEEHHEKRGNYIIRKIRKFLAHF